MGGQGRGGRGGEVRGGREGGRQGGREGGRGGMTVIHIPKTPQYLNSRHVTYYVITCKSAFDWVYAEQWYVIITFDVTDTHPDRVSEIHANKAVEDGCTNKLCPFP